MDKLPFSERLIRARKAAGLERSQVAARLGVSVQSLSHYERGKNRPSLERLERLASIYGTTTATLLGDAATPNNEAVLAQVQVPSRRDLPVFGAAQGGAEGAMVIGDGPIDYIDRPGDLAHVTDAFAVYMVGDSMEPRFKQGEILYINPQRPFRPGQDVLIELLDSGERYAIVKTVLRVTPAALLLKQHNPALEFEVERSRIVRVSLITGTHYP